MYIRKEVYMPHKTCRLLGQMYLILKDSLAYSVYYDKIKEVKDENDWLTFTRNSYYDLIIMNWCKLFGSWKEPTHYYNLCEGKYGLTEKLQKIDIQYLNDKKLLKKYLLSLSGIDKKDFNLFHKKTKKYRDKNLIHTEHDPEEIQQGTIRFPVTDFPKRLFYSLYKIIMEIFEQLPNFADKENTNVLEYAYFRSEKNVMDYFFCTFPTRFCFKDKN